MILFVSSHRDKTHVDWVKAYVNIWTELQNYIKEHHTTGLTWSKTVSLKITIKNLLTRKRRSRSFRLKVKSKLTCMFWAGVIEDKDLTHICHVVCSPKIFQSFRGNFSI